MSRAWQRGPASDQNLKSFPGGEGLATKRGELSPFGCGASEIMEHLPSGVWAGISIDSGFPWHGPGQFATTQQSIEKGPTAGVTARRKRPILSPCLGACQVASVVSDSLRPQGL